MKVFLAFVAILALAKAEDLSDLKKFVACFDKGLSDGIPSVGIPPYDPLEAPDFNFEEIFGNIFYLVTSNNTVNGLMSYTLPVLDIAEKSSNRDIVAYDYEIYWPKLILSGNWEYKYGALNQKGTYKVALEHLTWSGIFNLTKPGQEGYNATVNDFTLSSVVKNVEVEVIGTEYMDQYYENTIKAGLTQMFNKFPTPFAEYLRTSHFNDYWLGHPEKIQAIMKYCGLSN